MPDDLSNIFAGLVDEQTDPVEAPTETETETETEPATETETETKTKTEETAEPAQDPTNQAFAALRADNAKYKKFFNDIKDKLGLDEDAFMTDVRDKALASKAKDMNVSPEVLKKMQEQEDRLNELTQADRQKTLMVSLQNLQQTYNLSNKDLQEFVQDTINKGVDLYDSVMDLSTLYKALNHDKLVAKAVEDAKQEFIKNQAKANDASDPTDSKGRGEGTGSKEIKNVKELDALIDSLGKN